MYSESYRKELGDRKEAEKLAHEKMARVASLLGGTWNNDRGYSHGAYLHLPNCKLFYRLDKTKSQWRLDISYWLDHEKYSGYNYANALLDYKHDNCKLINERMTYVYEVTCALSHPPERIVTYVKRILPSCIELERRAQVRYDKNLQHKNLTQESVDKLKPLIPGISGVDKDSRSASAYSYELYSLKLTVSEQYVSSLQLAYLPIDLAIKVIELLKAHQEPKCAH